MSAKNVLLVALVIVNMLLITALVLQVTAPRQALAQPGPGGAHNYAVVTARLIQGGEEALWILDCPARKLAAFRLPQGAGNKILVQIGWVDLTQMRKK